MKGEEEEEEEEEEEVQLREQMGLNPKFLAFLKWDEAEQEEKPETLLTRAIDTEKIVESDTKMELERLTIYVEANKSEMKSSGLIWFVSFGEGEKASEDFCPLGFERDNHLCFNF